MIIPFRFHLHCTPGRQRPGERCHCPTAAQTRPNCTRLTSTHEHQRRERSERFRANFPSVGVQGRVPLRVVANAARRVRIPPSSPQKQILTTSRHLERRPSAPGAFERQVPAGTSLICEASCSGVLQNAPPAPAIARSPLGVWLPGKASPAGSVFWCCEKFTRGRAPTRSAASTPLHWR